MSLSLGNLFEFDSISQNGPFSKKENLEDMKEKEDMKEYKEVNNNKKEKDQNWSFEKFKNQIQSITENLEKIQNTQKKTEENGDYLIDDPHTNFAINDGFEDSENMNTEHMDTEIDVSEGFNNKGGSKDVGAEIPFWVSNPNILLSPRFIYEWFPIEGMTYNQKLNAISRLVILLTIISYLFLRATRLLWIGGLCLFVIFILHYSQTRSIAVGGKGQEEGFIGDFLNEQLRGRNPANNAVVTFATDDLSKIGKKEYFDVPKINNPYNNVLVTDIVDNPQKLPAPPAYYPETEKAILDRTKEAIQKMNPTYPGIMKKLFNSFDDHFEFEQSMRQFVSNPATTVPNDQGAFAEFCYGGMISCKEGNQFACSRDSARYNLY